MKWLRPVRAAARSLARPRAAVLWGMAAALCAAVPAEGQNLPIPGGRGRQQPRPQQAPPRNERPAPDTVPPDSARAAVQDTLIDRLLQLPGYQPVEYQGDSAQFENRTRTLRLHGDPVVKRAGSTIAARDSIIYRERTDFVEVYGNPRVTGEGQDIEGEVIYYDIANRRASVRNARTTVSEGATWYVQGNVTTEEQGERVYATGGTFTSDDREDPAYHFRATRLKVIKNRVLVGRPAYLYFRNVPVFVLPFIVQDLGRGRRSGFLIPEFEINDIVRTDQRGRGTRGTGRQIRNIGYYWALSEYMGLQAALDWRSQSWLALDVGYQFNWQRRFLSGSASLQHYWREEGTNQFTLNGAGSWKPNERTDLATAINYASSTRFERDRVVDPFRQTSSASSTLSLTRRADWGTITSGSELRQEISSGDNHLRTRLSVSPQTITLFSAGDDPPRWYNDASLTLTADGSADRRSPGDALVRRQQGEQNADASLGGSLRFGPISISGSTQYQREHFSSLAAIDSAAADSGIARARLGFLPGYGTERLSWNASTGYEFRLIGATRLTPSISIGQEAVRRDTGFVGGAPDSVDARRYGQFVSAPLRLTFGTGLRTELFGFFPGFGPYQRMRHHISPGVDYRYQPAVRQDTVQALVYGRLGGREVNEFTFNLSQTFEAKLRAAPRPSPAEQAQARAGTGNPQGAALGTPGAQTDTARAELLPDQVTLRDTASADTAASVAGAGPDQARKVTLLAISTSALAYSFIPTDTLGTRFQTQDLNNTIRSDLFGGMNFTVSHSLFADRAGAARGIAAGGDRRFSPFLTGVQTSLSFGANSALFRWLGFSRASEGERRTERGQTPAEEGVATVDPPGAQTMTNRPIPIPGADGGGAWNVALTYSLRRTRPAAFGVPQRELTDNQQLSGNVTFFPTRNWAVNWYTDYSITRNQFGTHVLNFKRDLYRWQANFDFIRAPNGNTSFSFSVHLQDLPDLKADYSRQNLGADRATRR